MNLQDKLYTPKEALFTEISANVSAMFAQTDPNRDFSLEGIYTAFRGIGQEPPPLILEVHNLLRSKPEDPIQRASLINSLVSYSEELGILHAQWSALMPKVKMAYYPPKEILDPETGKVLEKLTESDREIRLDAMISNFVAVRDIIYYMFAHCAKITLTAQQSLLAFDRDILRAPEAK